MTIPADSSRCSRCGAAKPADAPCPHCLLELGLSLPGERDARGRQPRAAAPDPAELAHHFPGLELLELIGQGGMGVVYRARHRKLDRVVALKLLAPGLAGDPAFAERFLREARAMARLDHPNIVAVHDFGETDGLCWLLMEFVDGTNLRQALASGALTPAQALAIVPQLCDALQAAHELGVVHRDIKPENVLLDRSGKVKIADFGLAKLSGAGEFEPGLTSTAAAMGTLHYMAPEQLVGSREVDHRADIFSLGVVFYEMLTGQLPLGRFEPPSRRVAVDVRMDVRIDEIVLRALEQEPGRRYQHAVEVKTDVQAMGKGTPEPARAAVAAASPTRPDPSSAPSAAPAPGTKKRRWFHALGLPLRRPRDPSALLLFLAFMLSPTYVRRLWGWGVFGLVLVVLLVVGCLYARARLTAGKRPGFQKELVRQGKGGRVARGLAFCLAAGAGLFALGAGLEATWELGTDHYVSPAAHAQARAEPWSEEQGYLLLDQLHAAGSERPEPPPELGTPNRDRYRRLQLVNPVGTLIVAAFLLLLAGSALAITSAGTDWRVVGSPLAATAALVLYVSAVMQVQQAGWPSTLHGIGGTVRIEGDVAHVRAALAEALEADRRVLVFQIGETLVEKRTREPLARHEFLVAVPSSPFERWKLERRGPVRQQPGVVFDAVGALDGSLTVLSWNAGMVQDGLGDGEGWKRAIEELLERVRREVEAK